MVSAEFLEAGYTSFAGPAMFSAPGLYVLLEMAVSSQFVF
jgi:hypothetical protein